MVHRKQRGLTISERRLMKRLVIVLTVLSILWLVFAPGRGYLYYRKMNKQVENLAGENKALTQKNAELKKEIEHLQNDDSYLEDIARHKYNMLKENETVYKYKTSKKKK